MTNITREQIEAKAYDRVAMLADKQSFFCLQQAEDCPLSRRSSWLEASKTLDEFSSAIRTLSPSTTRYVELPEGHVVVPVEATHRHIKTGGDYQKIGNARIRALTPLDAMQDVVIYRSMEDNSLWVREAKEFNDVTRFRRLRGDVK